MRPLAVLVTVLTCAAATTAGAQSLADQPLVDQTLVSTQALPTSSHDEQAAALAILNSAAFAPQTESTLVDPISRLIDHETYAPGAGIVRWMTGQTALSSGADGGPVDTLRVSVGGALRTPGGLPLNLSHAQYDPSAYEVAVTRDWPAAFAFNTGAFGVDVTPHAGVGMTNGGGSAEAGATLRLMQRDAETEQTLNAMGVRDGSAAFGGKGRWYLFAAASGRAVGFNMMHNDQGWDRAGLSTDATSTLIGDTQVGVGWRKGDMQTSFGYIHREVRGQNVLWGVDPGSDSMVAFSLSIRPHP